MKKYSKVIIPLSLAMIVVFSTVVVHAEELVVQNQTVYAIEGITNSYDNIDSDDREVQAVAAITTTDTSFRKGEKTDSDVICTIPSGTRVTVTDSTTSNTWCKIKYKVNSGDWFDTSGYVSKSSLRF